MCGLCFLDGRELAVSESFWCASLPVSWETDAENGSMRSEKLREILLVDLE
jgi:hypothetical protein